MITIRGFTITYKNAAFLGVGFCLGYAQALRDSDAIIQRLDAIFDAVYENVVQEDPEEAAERQAKAEAIPGTAVEVVREIEDPRYGHCDTCGGFCDAEGCMTDRNHVASLDVEETPKESQPT